MARTAAPGGPATETDGPEAGFEALHRRRYAAMVELAVLLLEDQDGATDVVHDAFAAVHERWGRVADPDASLRRGVVRRCRDLRRRRRPSRSRPAVPGAAYDELEAHGPADALAALPDRQRAAVVLHCHEGLGDSDLAAALGVTPAAAASAVHRGLARIGSTTSGGSGHGQPGPDHPGPEQSGLGAVEWRLSSELRARAAQVRPGQDGMAHIRDRITRRRRRRHTVAGLLTLAVLAVVAVGILDLSGSPDETDVVGAGAGAVPLLGFANETWEVVDHSPDTAYVVLDDRDGSSDPAIALIVSRDGTGAGGAPAIERAPERTIEHSEGPLQVGTVRWDDGRGDPGGTTGAAVWWSPAPGWTVTLTGDASTSFDDADALLAAADPVVPVEREAWQSRLRPSAEPGGPTAGR